MNKERIKSALEAILFVWGDPVDPKIVAPLFDATSADIVRCLRELAEDYHERGSGLAIREMDKTFQICTNPEYDDYIQRLCTPVKSKRLSQSSLEVLAIIAYKQPVTKAQIDNIRGIRCDRVLETLMNRGLVEELGRSSAIGRPYLYGTSREFLRLFGFESLSDLPEIEDLDILAADDLDEDAILNLSDPNQLTLPIDNEGLTEKEDAAGTTSGGKSPENQ